MKQLIAIILLVLAVTLFSGCTKEPPKPQSVVINILEIAEATGFNEQIKEHTKTINQQISAEMKALSDILRKEFEGEKAGFGDNPSEEDKKKIQVLQQQLGKQIMQVRTEGNARRTEEASEIRQSFVDDIMSFAQKVASEHGASIILTAMAIHWSDGSVDITNEVIDRMNSGKDTQPAGSVQN